MTSSAGEKKQDIFGSVEDENLDRIIAHYIGMYRRIKNQYDQEGKFYFEDRILKGILPEYTDEKFKSEGGVGYLRTFKEKIEQTLSKYADASLQAFIKTTGTRPVDEKLPSAETAYKDLLGSLDPNTVINNIMVYVNNQRMTSGDPAPINKIANRIVLFREAIINDYLKSLNVGPPMPPPAPSLTISMAAGSTLNIPPLS